ncbi:MAG: 16S rRNA (guanine(966)-N(2))-methyltransferase RsmD [Rhodospirillaceae bacterium]|nr:MAG: 16S rRNA (guanine(966)-N(2))-methyltransferase RsmD [Rhodospirillaceae bacterium]
MTLRIIAGKHRRRRLTGPKDQHIRPTLERVREAAFNVLAHGVPGSEGPPLPEGARVLDVFAGSGAMGFEALSRGAAFVTFLEGDAQALALLRENAAVLGETAHVAILRSDATKPALARPGRARDAVGVAFLDPPYGMGLGAPALIALRDAGWFLEGAVVLIEMAAKEAFAPPPGFRLFDERRYGTTRLVFLRYETAGHETAA